MERYSRSKFLDYTSDNMSYYPSPTGCMIGVDLAYSDHSAYGNWFSGLKPLMKKCLRRMMESNPAMHVLRQRVQKALQLYSSQTIDRTLNVQNYGELFSKDVVWFVDDSNVYRVTIHKTVEGNVTTRPANGAVIVFNPRTGQLFLIIIHFSSWSGQKRLSQFARWKTAEETSKLIRTLSPREQPRRVIVTRKGLSDPMEVHLLDFPNTVISGTDLQLPFQAILKCHRLGDLVVGAGMSRTLQFNLYDDWLCSVSSFTAFGRLILILRALRVNLDETYLILRLDRGPSSNQSHLWSMLDPYQWTLVEQALKELILIDYGRKNNVTVSDLTLSESKDILMGGDLIPKSLQRRQLSDVQGQEVDSAKNRGVLVKTHDRHGSEIVSSSSSPYEQQVACSKVD